MKNGMRQSVLSMFCAAYGKNEWNNLLDSRLRRSLQEMHFVIKHYFNFGLKLLLRLVGLCQDKYSCDLFLGMFKDSDECFQIFVCIPWGSSIRAGCRLIPKLSPED